MGRGKDQFIEETGGMRLGETQEQFLVRVARIKELRENLSVEGIEEIRRLKGLPDDEFDYEPADD